MLVDPNKIDTAIEALRKANLHLSDTGGDPRASLSLANGMTDIALKHLIECLNEGYGDRSEPTTYADMLASARSWAQDRIKEDPDADRNEIVDRAAAHVMVRVIHAQALIEVFMSKPDLLGVEIDEAEDCWDAMKCAVRLALLEDMADIVDERWPIS